MGKIRATDDEQLATQLWGDAKKWNDDRQQWLPTDGQAETDAGDAVAPATAPVPAPAVVTPVNAKTPVADVTGASKTAKTEKS